uniref:G-patch domain-containing protein n=1 Tax=Clastoptera arizonana TaxID=38151 RepID=A0A1B6DZX4_9HEMI
MSDSEDEEFVKYGTPLDPIEEDSVVRKRPISLEDQVVKDKYGRRRFHGAFTGGYSAGFFNSVGSLEGWTPSQFKSSRTAKADSYVQNAQDFMDEEDMDEFGIAPKVLRATEKYDSAINNNNRKKLIGSSSRGPIPGEPVLKNLLEPVRETVGILLLMKMGWKPGQGVGPRMSKNEKKKMQKIYGCSLPSDKENDSHEEDEDDCVPENVTFAPDDHEIHIMQPKDNVFGLGYTGLNRASVLSSHVNLFEPSSLVMTDKKKKVSIRGQAFGVGAFEEEDEDIYAKDDMNRYDFALDTPAMLAEKRKKEKHSKLLAKSSSDAGILEGFIASTSTIKRNIYPPPALPKDFIPRHVTRTSRFEPKTIQKDVNNSVWNEQQLTAIDRTAIVNETPKVHEEVPAKRTEIDSIEKTITEFKPFKTDPEKQERYEKYLTLVKQGKEDLLSNLQPLSMTQWEIQREKTEFEYASKLFRPLSNAMSDRFTTAQKSDDDLTPMPTKSRSLLGNNLEMTEAAKMNRYGLLTRAIEDWQPQNILCKRFNVPVPNSGSTMNTSTKKSRPKFSVFNFLDAAPHNVNKGSIETEEPKTLLESPKMSHISAADESQPSSPKTTPDLFEEPPNKVDLFKAIFLSSSDESDLENEESKKEPIGGVVRPVNVLRNTSPPRGIFANIDLISLSESKKSTNIDVSNLGEARTDSANLQSTPSNPTKKNEGEMSCSNPSESIPIDGSVFGVKLPPNFTNTGYKPFFLGTNNDDEWTSEDEAQSKKSSELQKFCLDISNLDEETKSKKRHKHKRFSNHYDDKSTKSKESKSKKRRKYSKSNNSDNESSEDEDKHIKNRSSDSDSYESTSDDEPAPEKRPKHKKKDKKKKEKKSKHKKNKHKKKSK